MVSAAVSLKDFDPTPADVDLACRFERNGGMLDVCFTVFGDLKRVTIPPPAKMAARTHRLWEKTCLECFISESLSQGYWEFNLSPSGHWNVYRFDAYRQGMIEENAFDAMPLSLRRQPHELRLSCTLDLGLLGLSRKTIHIGPAAVMRSTDGQNSYWAAVHPRSVPDFHHRDGFVVEMAP